MEQNFLSKIYDLAVVPSYTKAGYTLRSQEWPADEIDADLSSKIFLVTGASSGIGYAIARDLAFRNARVILLCRNAKKAHNVQKDLIALTRNNKIMIEICDLSKVNSIKRLTSRILDWYPRIDGLINNAGIMIHQKEFTEEGYEKTFATNVLGHFMLTYDLLPKLMQSKDPRIVDVTSGGMYTQKLNINLMLKGFKIHDGMKSYAQTKRAQVILCQIWGQKLKKLGFSHNCMHPGWVRTPGVETSMPKFFNFFEDILREPHEGSDTAVWLAAGKSVKGNYGQLYFDRVKRRQYLLPATKESKATRKHLWDLCLEITKKHATYLNSGSEELISNSDTDFDPY